MTAPSKTTMNGVLAFLIAAGTLAVATNHPVFSPAITSYITLALAGCRALVGFLETDAGVTKALVPGSPEPIAVPSHEIPDNSAAIPIKATIPK